VTNSSTRPAHSSVACHWACTVLIALVFSIMPEIRVPTVVTQWSAVIEHAARRLDERYLHPGSAGQVGAVRCASR
jgi:hypothetical protein